MTRGGSGHLDAPRQPAWPQGRSRNPQAPGAGPCAEGVFITVLKRTYFSPNVLQSWDSLICLARLYFLSELREKWFRLVIKNHLC